MVLKGNGFDLDDLEKSIREMGDIGPVNGISYTIISPFTMSAYNRILTECKYLISPPKGNKNPLKTHLIYLDKKIQEGNRRLLRTGARPDVLKYYPPHNYLWLTDAHEIDNAIDKAVKIDCYKTLSLVFLSFFFRKIIKAINANDKPTPQTIIDQQSCIIIASESLDFSNRILIKSEIDLREKYGREDQLRLELEVEKLQRGRVQGGINSKKISDKEEDLIAEALTEIITLDSDKDLTMTGLVALTMDYVKDRCVRFELDINDENQKKEKWYRNYIKNNYTTPAYLSAPGKRDPTNMERAIDRIRSILAL